MRRTEQGEDKMNVKLPPDLEAFVTRKLQSGVYESVEDVVQEGLLLQARDEFTEQALVDLRKEVAIGLEQSGQGKVNTLDEALIERIKASGRERRRRNGANKAHE